jgi:PA domain
MKLSRKCLFLAVLASGASCVDRNNSDDTDPGDVGQIRLRLVQTPPEVNCVQLTVRGARVARRLLPADTPGTDTLLLEGLPLGPVSVVSEAFSELCNNIVGRVPLWVTEPVMANIKVTPPIEIDLVFHRNGRAEVVLTFQDEPDGGMAPEPVVLFNSFTILGPNNVYEYRAAVGIPTPIPPPPTSGNFVLAATSNPPLPPDDACNPLPPGSLTGRVALVHRGVCTFATKAQNVADAGGVAMVVENNIADQILITVNATGSPIPVVFITKESGDDIRANGLPAVLQWNPPATVVR